MKARYINPFTDFGFKKIFGEEANKELLIDFINELLKDKAIITDITYLKTEHLGISVADRKAVFDLYCKNDKGERFIVELQKAKQKFFKDRSLYYSTFAIQEQAEKGEWNYQLQGVYTISIMDFIFDDIPSHQEKIRHNVRLMDTETKEVFYNKLMFIYLEMPKFNKPLDKLETHYDKWLFLLKNLPNLDRMPDKFKLGIFEKLFEIAEIANYNEEEQRAYQDSLKYYRDLKNVMDTAIEEALDKRNIEIAINALKEGIEKKTISILTGLSIEEIENLM
ncbi:MAG: Rpn family recombination-promoting nuclease/putative transposase [Microscillaceae bacterium]|nr:Rpn family recombination-promoting nuclease/putative transposase [Microscillaceae bacterium]